MIGATMERRVLQLGDPALRRPSQPVEDLDEHAFRATCADLRATLAAFQHQHGFGRAISAPQIGIARRAIAIDLQRVGRGHGSVVLINPEIVAASDATFTLWDDCMSFPDLLVRVRRHQSVTVTLTLEDGAVETWSDLDPAGSELLQHEIDHLDGVLAIDRAIDRASLLMRNEFERDPQRYLAMVDRA
jgi:peptide deformylase